MGSLLKTAVFAVSLLIIGSVGGLAICGSALANDYSQNAGNATEKSNSFSTSNDDDITAKAASEVNLTKIHTDDYLPLSDELQLKTTSIDITSPIDEFEEPKVTKKVDTPVTTELSKQAESLKDIVIEVIFTDQNTETDSSESEVSDSTVTTPSETKESIDDQEKPETSTEVNITFPENIITAPWLDIDVSKENSTVPESQEILSETPSNTPSNSTQPDEVVEIPENDDEVITLPEDNESIPSNDTTQPDEVVEIPENNITVPENNITVPENNITVPENNVSEPENNTTTSPDTISMEEASEIDRFGTNTTVISREDAINATARYIEVEDVLNNTVVLVEINGCTGATDTEVEDEDESCSDSCEEVTDDSCEAVENVCQAAGFDATCTIAQGLDTDSCEMIEDATENDTEDSADCDADKSTDNTTDNSTDNTTDNTTDNSTNNVTDGLFYPNMEQLMAFIEQDQTDLAGLHDNRSVMQVAVNATQRYGLHNQIVLLVFESGQLFAVNRFTLENGSFVYLDCSKIGEFNNTEEYSMDRILDIATNQSINATNPYQTNITYRYPAVNVSYCIPLWCA